MIKAVTGLSVDLSIAASSLWSGDSAKFPANIPANVTVGSRDYRQLRDLYAKASLAVVPLKDSPYQHGITAIQEAMAMGLPVIVTRTKGQSDVVIDRRRWLRSNPARQTHVGFAQMFRPDTIELRESNGFYVGVGDVAELRKCISYLLKHRDVATSLGSNAQRFAREILSVELFVKEPCNSWLRLKKIDLYIRQYFSKVRKDSEARTRCHQRSVRCRLISSDGTGG